MIFSLIALLACSLVAAPLVCVPQESEDYTALATEFVRKDGFSYNGYNNNYYFNAGSSDWGWPDYRDVVTVTPYATSPVTDYYMYYELDEDVGFWWWLDSCTFVYDYVSDSWSVDSSTMVFKYLESTRLDSRVFPNGLINVYFYNDNADVFSVEMWGYYIMRYQGYNYRVEYGGDYVYLTSTAHGNEVYLPYNSERSDIVSSVQGNFNAFFLSLNAVAIDRSGYERGYSEGYTDGVSDGETDGYTDGLAEGRQQGRNIGYQEGLNASRDDAQSLMYLFGAIASVPISILNGMSPLAIWGTPLIGILVTLLFVLLLAWLVRRFI